MRHLGALLQRIRLFVFDYDKTLARTDLLSPNGLTVEKAYELALDEMFGTVGLLQVMGGLDNRAPAEIAAAALALGDVSVACAWNYYAAHRDQLQGLVPAGKGVDLTAAFMGGRVVDFCAELLTRVKLRHLCDEVRRFSGGVWPMPCDGVLGFLEAIDGRATTSIISSGHDRFIDSSFRVWKAPEPALCVTDDDVRGLLVPVAQKTKPSPYLFEVLLEKAASCGMSFAHEEILFIGDDSVKDGGLAENAGVTFLWYNADGRPSRNGIPEFRDWNELAREL